MGQVYFSPVGGGTSTRTPFDASDDSPTPVGGLGGPVYYPQPGAPAVSVRTGEPVRTTVTTTEHNTAIATLDRYKVEGDKYDLSKAVVSGVPTTTMLKAGFTVEQIARARDTSTATDKAISLDRYKAYYFREKNWKTPHLGLEPEKLEEYNQRLRESTAAYIKKHGNERYLKEVGSTAPGKLLEIVPALWMLPGGNVLAVSVPIAKGTLGAEGWSNVTGSEYFTGAVGAIGLTQTGWNKLVKWAEKNATPFNPRGEYVHMGDVITADKAPKNYRFIQDYVDIGGGKQVLKPAPATGVYSEGAKPVGELVRRATPGKGGWLKETVKGKTRYTWDPGMPMGSDMQIYNEVEPEVAKQLKQYAQQYKASPNRSTIFEVAPMANGGFRLDSKAIPKKEFLDLTKKKGFYIIGEPLSPPRGDIATTTRTGMGPITGSSFGTTSRVVEASTRTMTPEQVTKLLGAGGTSVIGIPLVKDKEGNLTVPEWATPVSVPGTKIKTEQPVDPYVSPFTGPSKKAVTTKDKETDNPPVPIIRERIKPVINVTPSKEEQPVNKPKEVVKPTVTKPTTTVRKVDTPDRKPPEKAKITIDLPALEAQKQPDEEEVLPKNKGAVAWKMGQVAGKPVVNILRKPFKKQKDLETTTKKIPAGVTLVKGKGSAQRSAVLLTTPGPKNVTIDSGAMDLNIKSSGKRVRLKFRPDPLGKTHNPIRVGRPGVPRLRGRKEGQLIRTKVGRGSVLSRLPLRRKRT